MISLAFVAALSFAAAQAGPPVEARNKFAACLSQFSKTKAADKMDDIAFRPAVKAACAAEEEAFRSTMVKYDVKMGSKKASAEARVQEEIGDYFVNTAESYQLHTRGPSKPQ